MAHVGQEIGLGAIGRFGCQLRRVEIFRQFCQVRCLLLQPLVGEACFCERTVAFRQIGQRADEHDALGGLELAEGKLDRQGRPVPMHRLDLATGADHAFLAEFGLVAHQGLIAGAFQRRHQHVHRSPGHLRRRPAEEALGCRVEQPDTTLGIGHHDADTDCPHQRRQADLFLLDPAEGLDLARTVAAGAPEAMEGALLPDDRLATDADVPKLSVGASEIIVEVAEWLRGGEYGIVLGPTWIVGCC